MNAIREYTTKSLLIRLLFVYGTDRRFEIEIKNKFSRRNRLQKYDLTHKLHIVNKILLLFIDMSQQSLLIQWCVLLITPSFAISDRLK